MDRRDKLLSGLRNLRELHGVEIGALDKPIVTEQDGPVIYVDHTDTETLRQKYAADPNVNASAIVNVGAVAGEATLVEALGPERKYDYVIASHVVEHVPDLVGWLNELSSVLRPGGTIRLAVPDKRYTFDIRRSETRLADVVEAFLLKPRRPLPNHVVGFELHYLVTDIAAAWRGEQPPRLADKSRLAHCTAVMDLIKQTGQYWDVHCWVFTPQSFAELMEQLAALDLITLSCDAWFETEHNSLEFIVILREGGADPVGSWRRVVELYS